MSDSPQGRQILVEEAVAMTTAYREVRPDNYPICETFDRHVFEALLNQADCTAIRIYYGMKVEDKTVHAILVGVDSKNQDIVGAVGIPPGGGEGDVFEDGNRCPDACPPPSPLNLNA